MGASLADDMLLEPPAVTSPAGRIDPGLPVWTRWFRRGLFMVVPLALLAGVAAGVWHVAGLPRAVFKGHSGAVMSVAFAPDGRQVASGSQDGIIKLWDLKANEQRALDAHTARVTGLAFSSSGRLLASGSFDRTVKLWDVGVGQELRRIDPDWGQVHAVAFSPDGRLVAAAIDGVLPAEKIPPRDSAWTFGSVVGVWDVNTGEQVARLQGGSGWFVSVSFAPDGKWLAAGARQSVMHAQPDDAWVWSTASWERHRLVQQRSGILAIAFTPDSRQLAIGGWTRSIQLVDLQENRPSATFGPHGRWITSVAVSGDGRLLASGGTDQTVRVWNVAENREQARFRAHSGWVLAVAFAPDGKHLASAGQDGLVKLWAVAQAPAFHLLDWLKSPKIWAWIGFHVFIILMLAIDLGLFQRQAHVMTTKEAAGWYVVWVVCAVLFGLGVWFFQGNQKGVEFAAGYLIEQSLSVDNLFVFIVIFRYFAVPAHLQHRVLFWGIIGALLMRATFILVGAELLTHFHWTLYLFGAFLIYTGYKLLRAGEHEVHPEKNILLRLARKVYPVETSYESNRFFVRKPAADGRGEAVLDGGAPRRAPRPRLHMTPLFLVLLVIESTDVVFAVDSIPAILAVFQNPRNPDIFIAYTSNIFAILGLRSLFFLLAGFLGMFRYLNVGLALVLSFVGVKMLLAAAEIYKIDSLVSLAVIASILGVSIVASIVVGPKKGKEVPSTSAGLSPSGDS